MALANIKYSFETLLLASILDAINLGNWMKVKNGATQPKSVLNKLLGKEQTDEEDKVLFDSAEEFEQTRKKLLEGRE